MSTQFEIVITGNVNTCRTEAEISAVSDAGTGAELVALVFEDSSGVQVEWFRPAEDGPREPELVRAVEQATVRLKRYVNRRGQGVPNGLTRAGLSLWLMERDDGTSMGMRLR